MADNKKHNKKFRLLKGDNVIVIAGKDKGKQGEVLRILKDKNRVVVSGINIAKKHQKPSYQSQGGIIDKELSIHVSNVALVDPKDGSATKVGYKFLEDGKKIRFAKKSGEDVA